MCDYSLHGIANRLAEQGEVLVIHRFYTGSKGLTSPEYLKPNEPPTGLMALFRSMFVAPSKVCAVCIPDGAKLILHNISPALQQTHGLSASEGATFRQLSVGPHTYRDAVEFKNGVRVRLQQLDEGQNVKILALSSENADTRDERLIAVPV